MKRILLSLLSVLSVLSVSAEEPRGELVESMPPASQILAAARAQLPPHPVVMSGTLKERAANSHVKKTLNVEMKLSWGAAPPQATYQIRDEKNDIVQRLEIQWLPAGPEFQYSENGDRVADFNPNTEIQDLGVTWADLSFSFLWSREAETLRTDKKLGKECFVVSVPRPENHALLLWVEQDTGRMLGAEERDAEGKTVKIIKVVSVKEFDGLWMVKDLDIIRPGQGGRTSLRIDTVEMRE